MLPRTNKENSGGRIMLKLRITYADESEKDAAVKNIEENFNILNISRVYPGRNGSKFSNIYIDLQLKK